MAQPSGLLILHGNRLELLQQTLFEWLARAPLGPLDEEVFLVQSNGMAEWLKRSLAQHAGVCAAARVELPARFLWRSYRAMLGAAGAPRQSAFDKAPLTWRLMRLLDSGLLDQPGFEPLAVFLAADQSAEVDADATADVPPPRQPERRLQLAQRLADLYDQYQIYRADWLDAWAAGHEVLPAARLDAPLAERVAAGQPLAAEQRWQALLWRALLAELDEHERAGLRPAVHRRFVAALQSGQAPQRPLPPRVVVVGLSNVPLQTLEALAALAQHCQVLLAVTNPCQYHWADIIDGRELLYSQRRRHATRAGVDLAALPLEAAHAQAHPLLAAWGRQGRDFVRLLDAFDESESTRARLQMPRIDLFDATPPAHLLAQLQTAIRELLPLAEHPRRAPQAAAVHGLAPRLPQDRSIVFHSAHSAQREVEVLHDQLLALLARPPESGEAALTPRDIVVMVPDIEPFAPAIRAVFGQYGRHDPRHIPFEIADLRQRGRQPILIALEWLLRQPQRASVSELRDLLDVPALAARFGLDAADLPLLTQWLAGAGVRWGLDAEHRASLGLGACGDACSWAQGLQRMLLGYAVGEGGAAAEAGVAPWAGIEPYAEVGGLSAALAGGLAALLAVVQRWWRQAEQPATPEVWAERARALLQAAFKARSEADRLLLASLDEALGRWLDACASAAFDAPVPLAALREAWLGALDEPGLHERFLGGGVTFCTLMPMRSIPFEVVCLLGMNDGDYPRQGLRSDIDLMALPGQRRPGDRARRDDDRYLMLEALLAARRQLYISWAGRSPRDQSLQPPSVLVAQLRDYLDAGWDAGTSAALSTEHPLQAFSRRYFEPDAAAHGLLTYAREWRAAHRELEVPSAVAMPTDAGADPADATDAALTLALLSDFLRNPVRSHFRHRLQVVFDADDAPLDDDEPFALDALQQNQLLRRLLADPALQPLLQAAPGDPAQLEQPLRQAAERLQRSGLLPLAGLGERQQALLQAEAGPMLQAWQTAQAALAGPAPRQALRFGDGTLIFDDWLDGLQHDQAGQLLWLELSLARLTRLDRDDQPQARPEALLNAWLRACTAAACGVALQVRLVGRDALLHLDPPDPAMAAAALGALLAGWQAGSAAPLPLARRTALRWLDAADDPARADELAAATFDGDAGRRQPGERSEDPCLQRSYADYSALCEAEAPEPPGLELAPPHAFGAWALALYGPLRAWAGTARIELLASAGADTEDEDER
jgi:exodeoxyribonuclease V gamma subunit